MIRAELQKLSAYEKEADMAELVGRAQAKQISAWQTLGSAVVIRAVQDYRRLKRQRRKQPQNKDIQKELELVETFFSTSRFGVFTQIDGKQLLEALNQEKGNVYARKVFMKPK